MVTEVLQTGSENAIKGRVICGLLGISPRELTQAIEKERRTGAPICSNTGRNPGYYLAENRGEMERFCNSLRKRAGEIFKTRRACLNAAETLPQ